MFNKIDDRNWFYTLKKHTEEEEKYGINDKIIEIGLHMQLWDGWKAIFLIVGMMKKVEIVAESLEL